jgi:hypothetical protein
VVGAQEKQENLNTILGLKTRLVVHRCTGAEVWSMISRDVQAGNTFFSKKIAAVLWIKGAVEVEIEHIGNIECIAATGAFVIAHVIELKCLKGLPFGISPP